MNTYKFGITQQIFEEATVRIEAANEDEARAKLEQAVANGDIEPVEASNTPAKRRRG